MDELLTVIVDLQATVLNFKNINKFNRSCRWLAGQAQINTALESPKLSS